MKIQTLALRTLLVFALLFALYVAIPGGRVWISGGDARLHVLGEWSGECYGDRSGTPVFHAPSAWEIDLGPSDGIETVEVVTVRPADGPGKLPTLLKKTPLYWRGDKSLGRPKECDQPGNYAITFTGKGKWTAKVRY